MPLRQLGVAVRWGRLLLQARCSTAATSKRAVIGAGSAATLAALSRGRSGCGAQPGERLVRYRCTATPGGKASRRAAPRRARVSRPRLYPVAPAPAAPYKRQCFALKVSLAPANLCVPLRTWVCGRQGL